MNTEQAAAIIRDEVTADVVSEMDYRVRFGDAAWQMDPQVSDVAALIDNHTGRALVVVYGPGEWELSADMLDKLGVAP